MKFQDGTLTAAVFGAATGGVRFGNTSGDGFADFPVAGVPYRGVMQVTQADGNNGLVKPGDSGSVLLLKTKVDRKPAYVVAGLIFAAIGQSTALACHFHRVRSKLKLSLPSDRILTDWRTSRSNSDWTV